MAKNSVQPTDPWQAESDHSTLARAQEIREDPKRMTGVKKHHAKATRQLGKVGKSLGGKR